MTNRESEFGAVERIEVKFVDSRPSEELDLLDRDVSGYEFARLGIVVEAVESFFEPLRHGRAALFGKARQLREAGDRQYTRHDHRFDACSRTKIAKPKVHVDIEKELRYRA